MYPDIVRGDFGFPTILLKNAKGTFYQFARGNLKDFFDILRPNEPQIIRIPLSAFVYSRQLNANVPDHGSFFDQPVSQLSFDFLAHPDEAIDVCISNIGFESGHEMRPASSDLVSIERVGQTRQLPALSSENSTISLGISLNSLGISLGLAGSRALVSMRRNDSTEQTLEIPVGPEVSYFGLKLPLCGPYELDIAIDKNGEQIAHSRHPVCRMRTRHKGPPTILGISDEFQYEAIASVGGSWDRLPMSLQTLKKKGETFEFGPGANPFPPTPPGHGRYRIVAPFAMPKWLSRKGERADYHSYGPSDWKEYASLVSVIATEALRSGVTHYEVWNEASAIGHWNDDMDTLLRLHRVTYETVKSVAPEMVVLGGCTHSWTFDFLRSFFSAGGAAYCDGLAVHGYTYQPHNFLKQFDELDSILSQFCRDRPNFRTHITEIGFRHPTFSLQEQAQYLALYALEAASRDTIAAVLYFRLVNPRPELLGTYRQDASAGYAIIGYQGLYCRPSLATFRFVERLLQRFDTVIASGPEKKRRYEFSTNGSVEAVAVFHTHGESGLPPDWIELDQYGERAGDREFRKLQFAVSPQVLDKLI